MIKNASVYTITAIINAIIPFSLLPILTTYLSPSDYGKLSLLLALWVFVLPFVSLGITGGVTVNYFRLEKEEFSKYVGTVIVIISIITLILSIIFYFTCYQLSAQVLELPIFWIILLPFWAFSQSIFIFTLKLLQAKEKTHTFAILQLSFTLLNLLLSLYLVTICLLGWEGRQFAILISTLCFVGVSLFTLHNNGLKIIAFDRQYIKEIFSFGLPLIPHAIGAAFISMSDRLLISKYLGNDSLGGYAVSLQIASIVTVIGSSIGQAWTPYFYKQIKNESMNRSCLIVKYTYLIFIFILILEICVIFLSNPAYEYFINERYRHNSHYIILLCIGCGFNAMYFIISGYIFYHKKTHILSIITISIGSISYLMYTFAIQYYGLIGAVTVYAIIWFIFFVAAWSMANKIHPMPWFSFLKLSR